MLPLILENCWSIATIAFLPRCVMSIAVGLVSIAIILSYDTR